MSIGTQAPPPGISGASSLESLDNQIFAVVLSITANVLSLMVLQGFKEQLTDECPDKDYDYLKTLPKISTVIFAGVATYYLYLSWKHRENDTESDFLTWLLVANILAFVAALIKVYLAWKYPDVSTGVVEETLR